MGFLKLKPRWKFLKLSYEEFFHGMEGKILSGSEPDFENVHRKFDIFPN